MSGAPEHPADDRQYPAVHTCPECCQVLPYIDSILQHDYQQYGAHVRWWRYPVWYFLIRPKIRDYAATLLDESGK